MKAAYFEELSGAIVKCKLCPHECTLRPGHRGRCLARQNQDGEIVPLTYAKVTSAAMDPIEKKPLYHFYPGQQILSLGSWGCNLKCSFCQNCNISQKESPTRMLLPEQALAEAKREHSLGIAYTYNEPSIWFEYVRDCGKLLKQAGLKNVMVTNGFINPEPLDELLEVIDAMNIDIKAFHGDFYKNLCRGELAPVLQTAQTASKKCHVELTTLLIPEHNDAPKELDELSRWIADNCGPDTPAHLSAYFPRYQLRAQPTPPSLLLKARDIFTRHLRYVYLGNVMTKDGSDTICANCGGTVISRSGYDTDTVGMNEDGSCGSCGAANNIVTQ